MGEQIPADERLRAAHDAFIADRECPYCGPSFPDAAIGVEIRGAYDGVLYWQCGHCGYAFHRWPEGSPLRERAQHYIDAWNAIYEENEKAVAKLIAAFEAHAPSSGPAGTIDDAAGNPRP